MRFSDWYYTEMGGIRTMDTSHVNLKPMMPDFDRYEAKDQCQIKARQQDFHKGIYDYIRDDPDYKNLNIDDWFRNNPEPERNSSEYSVWRNEYIKVTNDIREKEKKWSEDQRAKKVAMKPQFDAFMKSCIEEAEKEHHKTVQPVGYSYEFDIGENHYKADFYKVAESEQQYDFKRVIELLGTIPGLFSITFKGPEDYNLTGKEGGKATGIYTQLLAGAKKLLDSNNVNGLYFSPADKKMALIYRKFFEDYLSNDFIQPVKYLYLRKSFLRERIEKLTPEQKQLVYSTILGSNRDIRSNLKQIQQEKMAERNLVLAGKKFVGKVAGYKQYGGTIVPVYVVAVKPPNYGDVRADLMMIDHWGSLTQVDLPIKADNPNEIVKLVDARTVDPDQLHKFVELLRGQGVKV